MAQSLDNHALTGKYFFRHVSLTTDPSENIIDIRSLAGSMTFDGAGNYSFVGQQTVSTAGSMPFNGNGTYSVTPAGMVSLTNPQRNTTKLNGRFGTVSAGEGVLFGSTTEGTDNLFDLFAAVQAPAAAFSNSLFSGRYLVATLEFPAPSGTAVHGGFFKLQPDGAGNFSNISVYGHAANVNSGTPFTQAVTGATYALMGDGSGIGLFPAPINGTPLLNGNKNIYFSSRGNVILGASRDPGVHDILIGMRALAGTATDASWSGKFWGAGLRFETGGAASSYTGSANAISALSKVTLTRRVHQLQPAGALRYDFTGVSDYSLASEGSGVAGLTRIAVAAAGNGFVGAAVDPNDPTAYAVDIGIRMPALASGGVFLHPQGVFNGGSFAPTGAPIAAGEFTALFGSGLAPQAQAAAPPYPFSLEGVSVLINNRLAPLSYVSGTQINALVPFATTEPTASIVVNNNGVLSNAVQVPVSQTAPGVFSLNQNGVGDGAILHADSTVVSPANPAHPGETVRIYLTGLGSVAPGIADGTATSASPLSVTNAAVDVIIGGQLAPVTSSELAPGLAGVYQLTVIVPNTLTISKAGPFSLAIRTSVSFHDQVDIELAP